MRLPGTEEFAIVVVCEIVLCSKTCENLETISQEGFQKSQRVVQMVQIVLLWQDPTTFVLQRRAHTLGASVLYTRFYVATCHRSLAYQTDLYVGRSGGTIPAGFGGLQIVMHDRMM